jgi:hypothetical protein
LRKHLQAYNIYSLPSFTNKQWFRNTILWALYVEKAKDVITTRNAITKLDTYNKIPEKQPKK